MEVCIFELTKTVVTRFCFVVFFCFSSPSLVWFMFMFVAFFHFILAGGVIFIGIVFGCLEHVY